MLVLVLPRAAGAVPIDVGDIDADDLVARDTLGTRLPNAKLLWVNNGKIWYSTVGDFSPQEITGVLDEWRPRWSPDGTRILFVRELSGVMVMDADFSNEEVLIANGDTADWTPDGLHVTATIDDGWKVVKYEVATGTTEVIYDVNDPDYADEPGYCNAPVGQGAELDATGRYLLTWFAEDSSHHETQIVDLQAKTYIFNAQMARGDCSPAWSPDGSYILNTARTGDRPVLRADFDPVAASISDSYHLVGIETYCQCNTFYIHGQRVSNDGNWIAFGGWIRDGALSNGHREIYIWEIGTPETDAVRMTFETNEDSSPSLWVPPADCADTDLDGYGDGAGCAGVDCDDSDNSIHPNANEKCNGVDDDCDDDVDEGFGTLGDACSGGVGACAASGILVCSGNGSDVVCDAQPGTPAAEEVCEGSVDDDCDGTVDNGCFCSEAIPCYGGPDGTEGVGECAGGAQPCDGGTLGACADQVLPVAETCDDNLDNDCDGVADGDDVEDCPGADPPDDPADPGDDAPPGRIVGRLGCNAIGWGGSLWCALLLPLSRRRRR